MRKNPLANGEVYHVFTRSIADFKIFNDALEYDRILQLIRYYQVKNKSKFSDFIDSSIVHQIGFDAALETVSKNNNPLVQIIAYCLMPTHIHLILKQLTDKGISIYMSNILNGYTRYFNIKHQRKGPLWESEFKNVLVKDDEQLLHLTRYLHLNPTTADLIKKPEDWVFSSYKEYLSQTESDICEFEGILEINHSIYRKFVNDRIAYQRELAKIKSLILD
ncbi:MAG: hypothetical protein US94_C0002G0024 [Berkelbacteria bacterium GW2011_GWB1_38_5]|uniref:Transposase IS200-like domain-containing protein n=2 Tax=Candidatus Berkelbacteria TaxID=1618330 RepID=A0A0G0PNY0_9BACT|nr:MAG: hypothetical protein US94_C0002G0024 [Berkelbacteria bacterium GW2011_GWB1_38_5]KKQ91036.1 MAG: hypothetical protein UT15_C0001G0016 [Berkelbacteria bacterium GW2011_GWA1_39_10]